MTLSALLVSVDQASTQLLQKALEELSIRVECCADFVSKGIRLAQERFDVVIVDGKSKRQEMSRLREIRDSNPIWPQVAEVRSRRNSVSSKPRRQPQARQRVAVIASAAPTPALL
jgi:DNA-binding response OmpR family regulator